MTMNDILTKCILRKSHENLVDEILNSSRITKLDTSEFSSILLELLAEEGDTLCTYRRFVVEVSLALTIMLSLVRETSRKDLAEKTIEIIKLGFETIEELKKNKYSCKPIEQGLRLLEEILKNVDELLRLNTG